MPSIHRSESPSLRPFAPPELPGFAATMDALTPVPPVVQNHTGPSDPGLSGYRAVPSDHSFPKHLVLPPSSRSDFNSGAYRHLLAKAFPCGTNRRWASPRIRRLATTPGRNGFVSYGLVVRIRLLSTPPCDDAVTFHYEVRTGPRPGLAPGQHGTLPDARVPAFAGMTDRGCSRLRGNDN